MRYFTFFTATSEKSVKTCKLVSGGELSDTFQFSAVHFVTKLVKLANQIILTAILLKTKFVTVMYHINYWWLKWFGGETFPFGGETYPGVYTVSSGSSSNSIGIWG